MKKYLLGLAAISLFLGTTSCTDELVETVNDGKNAIEFRTALGKQVKSRAAEVGISNLQTDGLTVFSFYAGSTSRFNTFSLTYSNPNWTYSPSVDQPGTGLRYYSVYPLAITDAATSTSATTHSFEYVIPGVGSQVDLIAARAATDESAVTLNFQHILSQVNFAVQGMSGVKIDISNISVNGIKDKSTYTFETGWGTLAQNSGAPTYVYPLNATALSTLAAGTSTNVESLKQTNGGLMLMPQTFGVAGDGTFGFTFSLTVDTDGDGDFSDETAKIANKQMTVNLCDFDTKTWAPGKRYLYVIDFTSFLVGGPITFTVTVADWADDNHNTVAETLHVADATKVSIEDAIARHSTANGTTSTLTTFPIAVANALGAGITISTIDGFDSGDEIRIEFLDNASAINFGSSVSGWTLTPPSGGRVVTLKKD
ncbi:fimbrillin family protein [Parabacteroides sp. PF5-9]|uniref:fimbrillin family protein n=1 Tax=Parabacteroides sp. PF5-9 TaxID=1742404 RepID=UPI0024733F9C|nr:fimbrillin family protein [Parabacteroides sp. PF5-9]MDH6357163.1 hypothetical protein [Parabacteroides sp. PF5-9]